MWNTYAFGRAAQGLAAISALALNAAISGSILAESKASFVTKMAHDFTPKFRNLNHASADGPQ